MHPGVGNREFPSAGIGHDNARRRCRACGRRTRQRARGGGRCRSPECGRNRSGCTRRNRRRDGDRCNRHRALDRVRGQQRSGIAGRCQFCHLARVRRAHRRILRGSRLLRETGNQVADGQDCGDTNTRQHQAAHESPPRRGRRHQAVWADADRNRPLHAAVGAVDRGDPFTAELIRHERRLAPRTAGGAYQCFRTACRAVRVGHSAYFVPRTPSTKYAVSPKQLVGTPRCSL